MPKPLADMLSAPLAWSSWSTDPDMQALLSDMQANILKGHGRDHTGNIFVSFAGMAREDVAALVARISLLVTSSLSQLQAAAAFRATGIAGGRVVCLFLSKSGYQALGVPEAKWPADAAFRAGMRVRGGALVDPAPDHWGAGAWTPGKAAPDAMILVGDDSDDLVTTDLELMEMLLDGTGATVLGVERGHAFRRQQDPANPKGEGMEHFGYADGRSQPLFLAEDVAKEAKTHWNPAFPPSQFVVADPGGKTPYSCGSYFVFRKLEQNVKGFKDTEDKLSAKLGNGERAGAMAVGRFEDGTPVTLHDAAQGGSPINDFTYALDPDGARCPFRGHIRKTNPRGDIVRKFSAPEAAERGPIMARRGITYGERAARQPDGDFGETDRPTKDVGLLFMAYMADIAKQFEFTQHSWVNNRDFVVAGNGVDPVLGQGGANPPQTGTQIHWKDGTSGKSADQDFQGFVTLQGGEYFFAPSRSFLASL